MLFFIKNLRSNIFLIKALHFGNSPLKYRSPGMTSEETIVIRDGIVSGGSLQSLHRAVWVGRWGRRLGFVRSKWDSLQLATQDF